jgi:hypothetical protein
MSVTGAVLDRPFTASVVLGLTASPVFGIMTLVTALADRQAADQTCSAAEHASVLSGMTFMYLLMAVLHLGPWMTFIRGR